MPYPKLRSLYPQYAGIKDDGEFLNAVHQGAFPKDSDDDFISAASSIEDEGAAGTHGAPIGDRPGNGHSGGATPAAFLPPITKPSDVYMAGPRLAKAFVEDVGNYGQARLLDPWVAAARQFTGQSTAPTPEEARRNQRAKGFEIETALGGPVGKIMGQSLGAIPKVGRYLANTGTGWAIGTLGSGVRDADPDQIGGFNEESAKAGGLGGAILGGPVGELFHKIGSGTASKVTAAPPVAEGVTEAVRLKRTPGNETARNKAVRGLKGLLLGYHSPEPLLAGKKFATGESLTDAHVAARRVQQDAPEEALAGARNMLTEHLGDAPNPVESTERIRQHMTAASMLGDIEAGKKPPAGVTMQEIEENYIRTAIKLSEDPKAQAVFDQMTGNYKGRRAEFQGRGYNLGNVRSYTPRVGLEDMEGLIPEGERAGRTPSFMRERGKSQLQDYDAIGNYVGYETAARKKIAEDDLFKKYARDPINLASTREGRIKLRQEGIPKGYVRYEAPMGAPGYGKQGKKGKPLSLVVPVDVAQALAHFYDAPMGETASLANKAGGLMAQTATTFNLPNRMTNIPSDLWMMLAGPAGEKGTWTSGIAARRLGNMPGALASMFKQQFGGTSAAANAGRELGAVSGTYQKEIGGVEVPKDLAPFYPPASMKERMTPGRVVQKIASAPFEIMRKASTATEAAPRLATSQEATARGLPKEEVRRLAHESTLPYGSGASKFARSKLARGVARFATYPSLADVRVIQGALKSGSRLRYAALLGVPPAAAALWNTQDEEHTAAEKRLKPWVKNSLHFLNKNAKGEWEVVVVRADPFSEMTGRVGLGQLTGRMVKAAKGVEPLDFSGAPEDVKRAYLNAYPVGPAYESVVTGRNEYGKKLKPGERVTNLFPAVRFGAEAFEEFKNGGAKGAADYVVKRGVLSGARPLTQKEASGK